MFNIKMEFAFMPKPVKAMQNAKSLFGVKRDQAAVEFPEICYQVSFHCPKIALSGCKVLSLTGQNKQLNLFNPGSTVLCSGLYDFVEGLFQGSEYITIIIISQIKKRVFLVGIHIPIVVHDDDLERNVQCIEDLAPLAQE